MASTLADEGTAVGGPWRSVQARPTVAALMGPGPAVTIPFGTGMDEGNLGGNCVMMIARRHLLAGMTAAAALPPLRRASAETTPKRGGILRAYHLDNPPSLSLLEETTISVVAPLTAVFNNLIVFDPHVPQNSAKSIIPDLATSWAWSDGGKQLDFTLRKGVTWHDGKPFTSADVVHTWNLILGRGEDKLRLNPRKSWYANVEEVVAKGDDQVTFRLTRPQPALLQILSAAGSPVYPAHVLVKDMRTQPIGTGPYRLVEYKRAEVIRLARNEKYWKPGLPYLDGIEWSIISNRATALLSFVSGKVDLTFPASVSLPLLKDLRVQMPDVVAAVYPTGSSTNVLFNDTAPPFDNPQLRRAVAMALDRDEFVRIMSEGKGVIGGAMLPPPYGLWGLSPEQLHQLDVYGPDLEKRRTEARRIMTSLGYGPNKHLEVPVTTRNFASYRDGAVLLIDQLRSIWIDGTLDVVDTVAWDSKMIRRQFAIAGNQTGSQLDEPDQQFFENYGCTSTRNFTGYCSQELEKLFVAQSMEGDFEKRKVIVQEIDRKLQEDVGRTIIFYNVDATCWNPRVRNLTPVTNSFFNGWRFEDVWLDT